MFQGRYKAIPVAGERAGDASQFKVMADYIHLNPARARLAGGKHGKLAAFQWSRLIRQGLDHQKIRKWRRKLEEMLLCEDPMDNNAHGQSFNLAAGVAGRILRKYRGCHEVQNRVWEIVPEFISENDRNALTLQGFLSVGCVYPVGLRSPF